MDIFNMETVGLGDRVRRYKINIKHMRVEKDQWFRYAGKNKVGEPVEPGNYIAISGEKLPDEDRKRFKVMAVVNKYGKNFKWLAPAYPYILSALVGHIPTELSYLGKEKEFDPKIWSVATQAGFDFSTLRPWQRQYLLDAQSFIKRGKTPKRGAIARVGGGKTLVGLLLCSLGQNPLVLAPRYLHPVWKAEAVKWGLPVPNISTYASAHKWLDKNIDVLICDESLLISNPDAKRTKSTQQLAKNTPVVLAMTGTPLSVAKNPLQARWINVIREGVVPPTKTAFQYSYGERLGYETIPGAGIEVLTVYEWDFDRLTRDFKPYCEVVDEREILKQVPEITFERIHLPRPKHFDMVLSGGATTLTTQKRLSQALAITDGFIYSDDKLPIRFDSVKAETALELYNNIGEPVVIVANWRESIEICVDVFEAAGHKPAVIDGKRDSEIELARFLNGETDIIILSAAKTLGMNLQERASVMVFLSLSSQPSMYQQALGRIHRPGQKKGCVVYHLLCESTLDERRLDLITEHTEASSKFIESLLAQELRGLVK